MKPANRLAAVLATVVLLVASSNVARAQRQDDTAAIQIGAKDIGGVVSSPQGREAGAWVIAETTELPTHFARIVVTDDQGRYLIPDLQQTDYSVWARSFVIVESPQLRDTTGQR